MWKGDYGPLSRIAIDHVCKEHRTQLKVKWDFDFHGYVIQCTQGEYPREIDKPKRDEIQ